MFQREKSGRTGSGNLSSRIGGLSIVDSELGPKKVRPAKKKRKGRSQIYGGGMIGGKRRKL